LVILSDGKMRKQEGKREENGLERESKTLLLPKKLMPSQVFCYIQFSSTNLSKPVNAKFLKCLQPKSLEYFFPISF